jgi:hypothetical protein
MSNTYRKPDTYKHYSSNSYVYTEAIDCLKCKKAVIAELDLYDNGLIIYDFGPYLYNSKIRHRHQADARTRVRVLERVAVNKRLLDDEDIGDHHYFSRREIN